MTSMRTHFAAVFDWVALRQIVLHELQTTTHAISHDVLKAHNFFGKAKKRNERSKGYQYLKKLYFGEVPSFPFSHFCFL